MTPYVATRIPRCDQVLFNEIRNAVRNLPDINLGEDEDGEPIVLSCHILARAMSKKFGVAYVDGKFCNGYDHSWLVTEEGNIIDVYPVAILGGPFLISGEIMSPSHWMYKKKSAKALSHGQFGKGSFRRSVARIRRALH